MALGAALEFYSRVAKRLKVIGRGIIHKTPENLNDVWEVRRLLEGWKEKQK